MSSSEPRNKRTTFDVHASAERSSTQKGFLYRLMHGENVLNLRPKFRVRHPIVWSLGVVAVCVIGVAVIQEFYTRAAVSDFYPSACLGSWQSPSNAASEPETVAAPGTAFTTDNSAVFMASGTQIFCGGFLPADFSSSGTITNISVNFAWQVGDAASPTQSVVPVSAPQTPPSDNSSTTASSTPDASTPTDTTPADTTPVVTPTPDQGDTSTPPQPTSLAPWRPMIAFFMPTAFADDSSTLDTTTTIAAPGDSSSTAVISAPPPDENFLQISYSTDGTTWIPIQKVSKADWQNFTVTLPVTDWSDLQKLQIRVDGIPTSIDVVPPVYLDGMSLEVHYNIPPLFGGNSGTQNPADAPTEQDLQTPVINTSPSDFAPVNGKSNFSAQEAPTFNYDLNDLPSSTDIVAPAATTTDQSTTTSPQSFNDLQKNGWWAFFYSTLDPRPFFGAIGLDHIWPLAMAQNVSAPPVPTPGNPVVAEIDDPSGQPTSFQPVISTINNQLNIAIPEPAGSFRPGRYSLKLWILRNGVIYASENNFTWGVLVVNFDKTIYDVGDVSHIGFGVLNDQGDTICGALLTATITMPDGAVRTMTTADGTIVKNKTCGPRTVTNNPDYSATLPLHQKGNYQMSITALTGNGLRAIEDQFEVQAPPTFDVRRAAPTRIYPPATYDNSITIIANADYEGLITEAVPASFVISAGDFSSQTANDKIRTLTWNEKLKKGDMITLHYTFKAPDVSPELYKLGPLQIGTWQESRQWQIAADAISSTVIVITSTASTTWVVPNNWSASNTIELIGGGGGGANGGTNATATGAGGGGGSYAEIVNFATSSGASIKIQVGTGGGLSASGTPSFFNWNGSGATTTCVGMTVSVCAMPGSGAKATTTAGLGGATTTSVGTTRFAGGAGGGGYTLTNKGEGGGGGGGAGGPNGNGTAGGNSNAAAAPGGGGGGGGNGGGTIASSTTSSTGGHGGNGSGGTGGGTGGSGAAGGNATAGTGGGGGGGAGNSANANAFAGGTGATSTQWTATDGTIVGPGGGGAGGGGQSRTSNSNLGGAAGAAGLYGGGGGGGGSTASTGAGGGGKAGAQGVIVITYTPSTITLGDGTQNSPVTIGPSGATTTDDVFTLVTNVGTSTISNVTISISTTTGVSSVLVTDSGGGTIYGSSTNPAATTLNVTTTNMSVSTSSGPFNIRIVPFSYVNMPTTPGTYTVTSTITAWTDAKNFDQTGSQATTSIVFIDNQPPADVTNASGTASNASVALSWTNPGDLDFATTVVLRSTSSITTIATTSYSGTGLQNQKIAFDGASAWTTNSVGVSVITSTGTITTYGLSGSTHVGIAFDGANMWVTNSSLNSVIKITSSGVSTTYNGIDSSPVGIAFDNTNMWTANNAGFLGGSVTKITSSGVTTTYNGAGLNPSEIAFDGTNMWTANTGDNSVTKIDPSGVTTTYTGTGAGPLSIAFDGKNMWTANFNDNSVTKIDPSGAMTTYTGTGAGPHGIAFDGIDMWTSNSSGGNLTRIRPDGSMVTYTNLGVLQPFGLVSGGGNIWIANHGVNSVTKLSIIYDRLPSSPVDGTNYTVGQTIGSSTVACVATSSVSNCTDSGLINGTTYYYQIFTEDSRGNYSTGVVPSSSPLTPNIPLPMVTNIHINGDNAINLIPNSTQIVTVTASSSDANGPGDILFATGTIYRSGVGSNCTADNQNCYQIASSSCSFANSSSSVSCSANIWYVAQPTDTSTYLGENWLGTIAVKGSGGFGTSTTATGVELNTLLAINITTSSINYGSVPANGASGVQTTTVQNVGNCSSTLALYGTDLALVGQPTVTIPVTAQQYATSSFSWGAKPQLSTSSSTVGGFLITTPTTTAQTVQSTIFWAIGGFIAPTGTYNGTTTFVAIQSP